MDRIPLEKKVLSENDRIAARLREVSGSIKFYAST